MITKEKYYEIISDEEKIKEHLLPDDIDIVEVCLNT
jgi:hypothetical protein